MGGEFCLAGNVKPLLGIGGAGAVLRVRDLSQKYSVWAGKKVFFGEI